MDKKSSHEVVILTRTLRNGQVTEERLERWMAELVIGCIPADEPNVARASIAPAPEPDRKAVFNFPTVNWQAAMKLSNYLIPIRAA